MRWLAHTATLVAVTALLACCAAPPMLYVPSSYPYYTADTARQVVHDTLIHWRIMHNRGRAHGPIASVNVTFDKVELTDRQKRTTVVKLDDLGIVDIANRTIEIGGVTMAADRRTTDTQARQVADTLLYLKGIAPYEPQAARAP